MLFCNVDHIEPQLLSRTRETSSRFFEASSSLMQLFRQMELGAVSNGNSQSVQFDAVTIGANAANEASIRFHETAQMLNVLAHEIQNDYPYINNEVQRANAFDDVARHIGLSPDSPLVRELISEVLRRGIDSVLIGCADLMTTLSERIRVIALRMLELKSFQDRDYEETHLIIADWSSLLTRGQFISVACYLAARIAS